MKDLGSMKLIILGIIFICAWAYRRFFNN